MRFSEYVQFVIDRSLVSNRTSFSYFYKLFLMAIEKKSMVEPPAALPNVIF